MTRWTRQGSPGNCETPAGQPEAVAQDESALGADRAE